MMFDLWSVRRVVLGETVLYQDGIDGSRDVDGSVQVSAGAEASNSLHNML